MIRRGTDLLINTDALNENARSSAEISIIGSDLVEISLINASVPAAAEAILGDALNLQYTIADGVDGRITIQTTGPIAKTALLDLFRAALDANGATLRGQGTRVSIVPGTSGNRTFRLASNGVGSGATIIVAPLEFVSAQQMTNLLDPLVEEGLRVVADRQRNLLLMSGGRDQLESAIDALNLFDVDVLAGKSIALVRLNSAEPEDVVRELELIFETEENGLLDGVVEFVPNNRLSSVLVISSRSRYLDEAQQWIRELDQSANRARRTTEVYPLQNRSAAEVAPILDSLLQEDAAEENEAPSIVRSRVAADPSRNALVVRAVRGEHQEIRRLLRLLDDEPRQVLIEATIAEVRLNDELSLGVRWFLENGNFSGTFTDATSGAIAQNFPGFSASFAVDSTEAVLNALSGVTDVQVISTPTLVVLDNKEAILQIGDQVPVATQTSVSTNDPDAPIVSNIEYRDTGVILNVKPQIGSNGRVFLDVTQEVSDVASTNTSGIDSPTIRQRQITTSVALRDGATLALGGLIRVSDTVTETKVPGLGDAPVVGALFRSRSSSRDRSELLILIRPRLIRNDVDAARVTDYWRSKLSGVNTILGVGLGPARHSIEDAFN